MASSSSCPCRLRSTPNKVITRIDPDKDVDGFNPVNAGRLAIGLPGFVPCTPLGCLKLLRAELGDLTGKDAVVVGRSNIVGKPMAMLLLAEHCTVTIAHSRTRDLPDVVRRADIVVAAVGRPEMVKGDWLKPGATVIDVGINRIAGEGGNSHLAGDVDFASASEVAGAITPVPGGVGPMTIACLIRNTLVSAARREGFALDPALVIELFTTAFVTLLVIIDPPGCAPIFASLTSGTDAAHRRSMAIRSTAVAWCILIFFALLGEPLLKTLGIILKRLPPRRRHHAVHHRAGNGVRKAHRAARGAGQGNRGHAGSRGHCRLPDGHPDDRRPGLDRLDHAAFRPRRRPRRGPDRPRGDDGWLSC